MKKLIKISNIILKKCLSAKKSNKILIIVDKKKKSLGKYFIDASKKITKDVEFIVMKTCKIDGEEPSLLIKRAMKNKDIVIELTNVSMTHTEANKIAMKNGAKIASMPAITKELLLKYIDIDYKEMKNLTKRISKNLTFGKKIKVITKLGTNLDIDINKRKGISLYGICKKGNFINLPDGESLVSPITANGILVIDGSMPPDTTTIWGKIGKIKNPIKVLIKNGKITKIIGKKEARIFENILDYYGDDSKKIAELGIGTNKKAKVIGNITLDEKALGTIHIAFGNSFGIGGNNKVPIHLDCVIKSPTVYIDSKLLMNKGRMLIDG